MVCLCSMVVLMMSRTITQKKGDITDCEVFTWQW